MFKLHRVDSLDEPALAPYRTMRRPVEHAHAGIFVAEGEKVVRRLLQRHELEVVSVLLPDSWVERLTPLLQARPETLPVYVAEKKVLEALTGFSMYQGVLAVGRIPPQPSLEELLAGSRRPVLLVAADGLNNAENIGALVRNCAALGAHGLLVGETCSTPWMRRSVRSSMGTVFDLPVVETASLVLTLRGLRNQGVTVLGAHPHTDGCSLAQADLTGNVCLVMGSEGTGLGPEVLQACNRLVAVPMQRGVDSLNVTSASAVFLYEAQRQRGRG